MNALRQRMRPKHQVLILKCYPRFQANQTEVKPNSSELSYLLYYASTRRSKLQKVAPFLEKKTERDIHKGRIGNVLVTLQILTALVEKTSAELPLYINHVLNILEFVLRSHDIGLIEESLNTFGAACAHYDSATLSADQVHTRQWQGVISTYASFAKKTSSAKNTGRSASVPETIRYRAAGLKAIKSLVASNSFYTDGAKHMQTIMPVLLENVYSERPAYLSLLQKREDSNDEFEKEARNRLRQSMSVQRMSLSVERPAEQDPSAAAGTTADVDRRADEELGVLAMQSLRQLFTADNRGQVRTATTAIISFVAGGQSALSRNQSGRTWAIGLFEAICAWTPVQDRFIILVTAMETLIRSPIVENDLHNQLQLTAIIGWLLKSNINFIGLSVMDVLIGLIQHILLLLQLGGAGSGITPHRQQQLDVSNPSPASSSNLIVEEVKSPSEPRLQLLLELQHCTGWLATHVYYSDQIGDMVSALLTRLKPAPNSAISSPAAAVQNPTATADVIAESANLQERPHTDGFFSFDTARVLALQAVKEIIVTANSKRVEGSNTTGRNRVEVATWDGTQWLLRDPDPRVRTAYVDALLTWLSLEVDRQNLRLVEDHIKPARKDRAVTLNSPGTGTAKRAVSNASQASRLQTRARSSFLELLHLAIYENALHYAEGSEADTLLLHLLLSTLVQRLGVNSIRHGLPMIFRLQEEVETMPSAHAKIALSSLVYGYIWACTEAFKLESADIGREVRSDIQQRMQAGVWLSSIRVPPLQVDQITKAATGTFARQSSELGELLVPFRARQRLVDDIADEYYRSLLSPPASPQPTPVRSPAAHITNGSSLLPTIITSAPPAGATTLPQSVLDQMLSNWTREACLARIESQSPRAGSVGSRGTNATNHLNANGNSPTTSHQSLHNGKNRAASPSAAAHVTANNNQFSGTPAARHFSTRRRDKLSPSASLRDPLSNSVSSKRSVVRVNELKRALNGGGMVTSPSIASLQKQDFADDTASESMMSASFAGSDDEFGGAPEALNVPATRAAGGARATSVSSAVGSSNMHAQEHQHGYGNTAGPSRFTSGTGAMDFARANYSTASLTVPGGALDRSGSVSTGGGRFDLNSLLNEIDDEEPGVGGRSRPVSGVGLPPY